MNRPRAQLLGLALPHWLSESQSGRSYRNAVFQFLAAYRFFAFAMGTGGLFVFGGGEHVGTLATIVSIVVGVVNVTRVIFPPFSIVRHSWAETVLLVGEGGMTLALLAITGGLSSPFILYSVTPILSMSLVGSLVGSMVLASIVGSAVVTAHLLSPYMPGAGLLSLSSGDRPSLAILYMVALVAIVSLPFLTNMNVQRYQIARAKETEWRRLQRELHDEVAQLLAFLSLKGQSAEEALSTGRGVSREDIYDMARGIRRTYTALRDFIDGGQGQPVVALADALQGAVRQWSQDTALPVTVVVSGRAQALEAGTARHLLQIAREALTNSARHGRPTQVWVNLEWRPRHVSLRVRDNGSGFDTRQPRGLGLSVMQERAAIIGAALCISSSRGQGTEVTVTWPCREEAKP